MKNLYKVYSEIRNHEAEIRINALAIHKVLSLFGALIK